MRTLDRARIARVCAPLVFFAWIACSGGGGPGSKEPSDGEVPDSVSLEVGVKGGVLKAKGLTLEIPEGALDKTVRLTIENKGKSAPSSLKTKQLSDTYEFGPEGTKFKKQVGITFEVEKPDSKAVVYFTKEGSREFEQIESEVGDGKVMAKVAHFSQGFVGVPLDDELDASTDTQDAGTDTMDAGLDAEAPSEDAAAPLPDPVRIKVQAVDEFGLPAAPAFAAYQDGDGPWQALAPSAGTGQYEFDVVGRRYGVAFVCPHEGEEANFASGTVYYQPRSETSLKATLVWNACRTEPTFYSRAGTVSVPGSETYVWYGTEYVGSFGPIGALAPSYSLWGFPHGVTTDLVVGIATSSNTGLSKVQIFRDVTLTEDQTEVPLDFINVGHPVGSATATALNASADTFLSVFYTTGGSRHGMPLGQGEPTGSNVRVRSFATLPESLREPSDRYVVQAYEYLDYGQRSATLATYDTGDLSVTLPEPFAVDFSALDTPYYRPSISFEDVPEATSYVSEMSYNDDQYSYRLVADARWFDPATSHTLTFPDLSEVAGFNINWMPPSEVSPSEVFVHAECHVTAGELETISTRYHSVSLQ